MPHRPRALGKGITHRRKPEGRVGLHGDGRPLPRGPARAFLRCLLSCLGCSMGLAPRARWVSLTPWPRVREGQRQSCWGGVVPGCPSLLIPPRLQWLLRAWHPQRLSLQEKGGDRPISEPLRWWHSIWGKTLAFGAGPVGRVGCSPEGWDGEGEEASLASVCASICPLLLDRLCALRPPCCHLGLCRSWSPVPAHTWAVGLTGWPGGWDLGLQGQLEMVPGALGHNPAAWPGCPVGRWPLISPYSLCGHTSGW